MTITQEQFSRSSGVYRYRISKALKLLQESGVRTVTERELIVMAGLGEMRHHIGRAILGLVMASDAFDVEVLP